MRIFVGATSDGEVMSYGKSMLDMLRDTCVMIGDQNLSGTGVRVTRRWFRGERAECVGECFDLQQIFKEPQ